MAVTLDAVGSKSFQIGAANYNYTGITVGSGSNRALIVTLAWDTNSVTPTSIIATWDNGGTNQAMTQIILNQSGTLPVALFGLVAPTSGNKTLNVSWGGGNSNIFIAAISFTSVDQTGGSTSFPNSAGAHGVLTQTINSNIDRYVVQVLGSTGALGTLTGTSIYTDSSSGSFINSFAQYSVGASPNLIIGENSGGLVNSFAATDILAFVPPPSGPLPQTTLSNTKADGKWFSKRDYQAVLDGLKAQRVSDARKQRRMEFIANYEAPPDRALKLAKRAVVRAKLGLKSQFNRKLFDADEEAIENLRGLEAKEAAHQVAEARVKTIEDAKEKIRQRVKNAIAKRRGLK